MNVDRNGARLIAGGGTSSPSSGANGGNAQGDVT